MVQKVIRIAALEITLLVRSFIFWAVAAAMNGIMLIRLLDQANDGVPLATADVVPPGVSEVLTLGLLAFILVAVGSAMRSKAERTEETLDTYPPTNGEFAAGQVLGLVVLFIGIWASAIVLGAAGAYLVGGGRPIDWGVAFGELIRRGIPSAMLGAGVGYLVGALSPSVVVGYPIGVAVWGVIVPGMMEMSNRASLKGIAILEPLLVSPFDTGTADDFTRAVAFALTLGALSAFLAATLVKSRRESKRSYWMRHLGLVATLVLAGVVLGTSISVWSGRAAISRAGVEVHAAEQRALKALSSALPPDAFWATDVLAYDMDIRLIGSERRLENTAVMQVQNAASRPVDVLLFTLRAEFEVEQVRVARTGILGASDAHARPAELGQEADFVREASFIQVNMPDGRPLNPGEGVTVAITYSGRVWDWSVGPLGPYREELLAFIDSGGAWLPAGTAWYPVGGAHRTRSLSVLGQMDVEADGSLKPGPGSSVKAMFVEWSHPLAAMKVRVIVDGMLAVNGLRAAGGIHGTDEARGLEVETGIQGRRVSAQDGSVVYEFESPGTRDLFLRVGRPVQAEISPEALAFVRERFTFYEGMAASGARGFRVGRLPETAETLYRNALAPSWWLSFDPRLLERVVRREAAGRGPLLGHDRWTIEEGILQAWWASGGERAFTARRSFPLGGNPDSTPNPAGSRESEPNLIDGVLGYAFLMFLEQNSETSVAQGVRDYWVGLEARYEQGQGASAPTAPRMGATPSQMVELPTYDRHAATGFSMLARLEREAGRDAVIRAIRLLRAGRPGRDGIVTYDDLTQAVSRARKAADGEVQGSREGRP